MLGFKRHPSVMHDDAFDVDTEPVVPTMTLEQANRLQDLAYYAAEAAAVLAVAETTRTGLTSARRAEKHTWAELTAAIHALALP